MAAVDGERAVKKSNTFEMNERESDGDPAAGEPMRQQRSVTMMNIAQVASENEERHFDGDSFASGGEEPVPHQQQSVTMMNLDTMTSLQGEMRQEDDIPGPKRVETMEFGRIETNGSDAVATRQMRTPTMNFGRWPGTSEGSFSVEGELSFAPIRDDIHGKLGSLADMVQRAIVTDQAAPPDSGKASTPVLTDRQLTMTVERVLKSKQVQDAIRTSARQAAAEALDGLMRSVANIEKTLSSRITTLEEVVVSMQLKQVNAKRPQHDDARDRGQQELWAILDTRRHNTPGQQQQQPQAQQRLNYKQFNSDPRGTRGSTQMDPRRLHEQALMNDPRGRQQHPNQQGQGSQQRLNSTDFGSAPAATSRPGSPSRNVQKPIQASIKDTVQLERLLMESAIDTLREGKKASKQQQGQPGSAAQPSPGQASGSASNARGSSNMNGNMSSILPGSVGSHSGAASSAPAPARGREYHAGHADDGADIMSNMSPQSSADENGQESRKKTSRRLRNFFGKQLGWSRVSTS